MAGKLTTHVLDTVSGRAAAGVGVELWRVGRDGSRELLVRTRTNHDGRTDEPLLEGAALQAGVFELLFDIGAYFARDAALPKPPFLDRVPVRFGIADVEAHYHVPLLASPWSYSTYRGS